MSKPSGKSLIIVESPAKIKTLRKILGSGFIFESSVGHIRDLPKKEFGIDLEGDFEPKYVTMEDKKQVIDKLQQAAKQADTVYLSPDPDREGEAIAWHIASILPKGTKIVRATFHSITKKVVLEALENTRAINQDLVDAQQARRCLDRIVGYSISPLLNRRMQRGRDGTVSAGRVQSVALKLVVDREKEIEAFKPVEYWNIAATLQQEGHTRPYQAALYSVDGKKVEKEAVKGKDVFLIPNEETAQSVVDRIKKGEMQVVRVERKEKKRNPVPPFITSTLQQEASRHFGFSASRTMSVAQGLYEGIDLGNEGTEGLITYMRTDSVRIDPSALGAARDYIKKEYGSDYLPATPRQFSTKKSAQDAHEAIRPTNLSHPPESVRSYLTKEQFQLYTLIWRRFVASQMNPAIYDTVAADIDTGNGVLLRATGSVIKFKGFLAVYEEKEDEEPANDDENILPPLEEGQRPNLQDVQADQAFTRPPPRFSEASLVKELEKSGIGRPSTYAAIMSKIQSREYTIKEKNRLIPTELGKLIAQMLETSFTSIMDTAFTANMEDELELVAESQKEWKSVLKEFWEQFKPTLDKAEETLFVPKVMTDIPCPKCEKPLQKIWARSKYFYGCSAYPDCDYTAPIEELSFNKEDYAADFNWDQKCPQCDADMLVRHGRYGAFLGCSKYPDCRGIVSIPRKGEEYVPPEQMPACPAKTCPGNLVARRSRFGKTFYSCSTFPDCDVIVNKLEELSTKYSDHERTAYVKKTKAKKGAKKTTKATKASKTTKAKGKTATKEKKKREPRNLPPSPLTPELAAVVGADELPRNQVSKAVWAYIKEHKLQDPNDGRMILPDEKLAKLFGSSDPMQMFKMTAILNKNIK